MKKFWLSLCVSFIVSVSVNAAQFSELDNKEMKSEVLKTWLIQTDAIQKSEVVPNNRMVSLFTRTYKVSDIGNQTELKMVRQFLRYLQ